MSKPKGKCWCALSGVYIWIIAVLYQGYVYIEMVCIIRSMRCSALNGICIQSSWCTHKLKWNGDVDYVFLF